MRLLITGAGGFVGSRLARRCADLGPVCWSGRRDVDLADPAALRAAWARLGPIDAVVHLAAIAAVGACEDDPSGAARVNTGATALLAELASAAGARLVYTSTDLVFDGLAAGAAPRPLREDVAPAPRSVYARTKADAEPAVLADPRHLVVRLALCRPGDWVVTRARAGEPVTLYTDETRSPLDVATAVDALRELATGEPGGLEGPGAPNLLHLAGTEALTRLAMGRTLLRRAGLDPGLATPAAGAASGLRPGDVSLDVTRARRALTTPLLGYEAGLDRSR